MVFELILGPRAFPGARGEGFDTETLEVGAGSLSFCRFLCFLLVFLGFPAGFPAPGPILESVFLWRCFCRQ